VYGLAIFIGNVVIDDFSGVLGEELLDLEKIRLLFCCHHSPY
jgi:hypothetical protein